MTDAELADSEMTDAEPPLRLYLASGSPRRKQLLEDAGLRFAVRLPQTPVDETLDDDELADPVEAAKTLAQRKAAALVQELLVDPEPATLTMVIGADTMVVKDRRIFGKPRSLSDATHMLRTLSGTTHTVVTGVSLWMVMIDPEGQVSAGHRTFADEAQVRFHPLDDERIAKYLRLGESFDKAGAYAAQGEGAKLIAAIDGDRDTVIGLPVGRILAEFPELRDAVSPDEL